MGDPQRNERKKRTQPPRAARVTEVCLFICLKKYLHSLFFATFLSKNLPGYLKPGLITQGQRPKKRINLELTFKSLAAFLPFTTSRMLLKGVKTDFLEPVQIFVEKKHANSVSKTPRINQRDKQRLAKINVRLSVFKKFSFIPLVIEQKL